MFGPRSHRWAGPSHVRGAAAVLFALTLAAVNGLDGIDALIRSRFDVVITDIVMPEQEGIETIQRIRELDGEIPIIAISGAFDGDDFNALDDARLIGADLAVEKPFDVRTLLDAVAQALGKRRRG